MQHEDLMGLTGRLLWGTAATRHHIAAQLLQPGAELSLELLAGTARSGESWRLRARCLEVLGLAAGQADQRLGELILKLLVEDPAG